MREEFFQKLLRIQSNIPQVIWQIQSWLRHRRPVDTFYMHVGIVGHSNLIILLPCCLSMTVPSSIPWTSRSDQILYQWLINRLVWCCILWHCARNNKKKECKVHLFIPVMNQLLLKVPVHVLKIWFRYHWRNVVVGTLNMNLQVNVIRTLTIFRVMEIAQWHGILMFSCTTSTSKGFQSV